MKNSIKKLCLILASSDITRAQLREASEWLKKNGVNALERIVFRIREAAEDAVNEFDRPFRLQEGRNLSDLYLATAKSNVTYVAKRIEKLLREEAGLSAWQAKKKLLEALEKYQGFRISPPPSLEKKAFSAWVEFLANHASHNLLLQEATKIRNEIVHGPKSDWPLKERGQ
jgi:hypothetical protein